MGVCRISGLSFSVLQELKLSSSLPLKKQQTPISTILLQNGNERDYENSALPFVYNNQGNPKPTLTFFITILYDEENLDTLNINILSMPNGCLLPVYGSDVLKAGKNPGKIRYNFSKTSTFRLLPNTPNRIKVVYFNNEMSEEYSNKLGFVKTILEGQA